MNEKLKAIIDWTSGAIIAVGTSTFFWNWFGWWWRNDGSAF